MGINEKYEAEIEKLEKRIHELEHKVKTTETEKENVELEKEALIADIKKYKEMLTDDKGNLLSNSELIISLSDKSKGLKAEIDKAESKLNDTLNKIKEKSEEYIELDEAVLLQSFGFYTPKYKFALSSDYKERLNDTRSAQKAMVKNYTAAVCKRSWSIEGSAEKGRKFIEENIKQIVRTFNIECDETISEVKFSNYETCKKRIKRSFEALNKLNSLNQIVILDKYLQLKYQELDLAYEYVQKVEEEKEELRQQRELHREEMRLAKEIEEKRAEIEKEQQHYNNAMKRIQDQIDVEKNEERLFILNEKKLELMNNLADLDIALKDIDYREANQRAGYVYIISNIGAFGTNIFKIGMTRRLDPQERVDELGGASVPFRYDVHALIFSDDAPKLETVLHRAFEDKRVNMVNNRKEFFNVTLEEIEKIAKENHDKTIEFNYLPDAQQYRESLLLKKSKIN